MLKDKQIKWPEYERLYKNGQVRVPTSTYKFWIYGAAKDNLEARLSGALPGGGPPKKGPQRGIPADR